LELISLFSASKIYNLPFSYMTLTRRVDAGLCPVHKRGKRMLVYRDEFETWLEAISTAA